jgi:hypothetical protein
MGKITNVHPGGGAPGDKITIDLEYDAKAVNPTTEFHVIFTDDAEALNKVVTNHDKANRKLTVSVNVPSNAETGVIEVIMEGDLPFYTPANPTFKVQKPDPKPFRVTGITPRMDSDGYGVGKTLTITTSREPLKGVQVYFPRTNMGPPRNRAMNPIISGNTVRVNVPNKPVNETITGKIKVSAEFPAGDQSALSRLLKFCGGGFTDSEEVTSD